MCIDYWNVRNVAQKNLEATEPRSSKWLELCAADEQKLFVQPHSVVRRYCPKMEEINAASVGGGWFCEVYFSVRWTLARRSMEYEQKYILCTG